VKMKDTPSNAPDVTDRLLKAHAVEAPEKKVPEKKDREKKEPEDAVGE